MEYCELNNGVRIPLLGMGGWAQKENDFTNAILSGYRLIDTAMQYGNEDELGKAIRKCGVNREELFVTTKLWNDDVRHERTTEALEVSLKNLDLDYVDLYLIHYPAEGYEKAWEDMIRLYERGLVRAIGVSNFQMHHIEEVVKKTSFVPQINQIETHPHFLNRELIEYCKKSNINVEAWCPIGGPNSRCAHSEILESISKKNDKSISQIVLRWQLQRGIISIPKTSNISHMKENFEIFDFMLTDKEMELINSLDTGKRMGADPDNFDF